MKGLDTARKWKSKITGLMLAGIGMLAFVTRDGLGSGADLSCTVLYLGMLEMLKHGRNLGTRLNILLDNTGADNKNNPVLHFLAWLVLMDYVTEASIFCMMVGHTYSRIDQSFRTLIVRLLSQPIYTVADLLAGILAYLQPYNALGVIELHCLWDWKNYFLPHVYHKFGGFGTGQYGSGMHEFVFRKDRQGDVRMWYRTAAKSENWLPQGEGMLVFKSTPQGIPNLKRAKKDSDWQREVVENTVRQWFRFMSCQPALVAAKRAEWQARFDALPVDGDVDGIAAHLKLQWAELPAQAAIAPADETAGALRVHSNDTAIPPVDPVTGPGRTATQVQAERSYYQRCVRARQGSTSAVFQSDFIFLKGPRADSPVTLCRVAHGLCIGDALAENISFTAAEYEQYGWDRPGFFGYFRPKQNPLYDPTDKKSGGQLVRRQQVTREDILVYDVQVFETTPETDAADPRKRLRVAVRSLRALAQVSTAQPSFSDESIPDTHAAPAQDGLLRPLQKNTVAVLRAELERRSLDSTGQKAVLVARLAEVCVPCVCGESGSARGCGCARTICTHKRMHVRQALAGGGGGGGDDGGDGDGNGDNGHGHGDDGNDGDGDGEGGDELLRPLQKNTAAVLRAELRRRTLVTSGNKDALVARLAQVCGELAGNRGAGVGVHLPYARTHACTHGRRLLTMAATAATTTATRTAKTTRTAAATAATAATTTTATRTAKTTTRTATRRATTSLTSGLPPCLTAGSWWRATTRPELMTTSCTSQ